MIVSGSSAIAGNTKEEKANVEKRLQEEEKNKPMEERSMELIEKLRFVCENDFVRLPYTEAIEVLRNSAPYKKGKFQYKVEWGTDLQSEHERYLVEKHFKKPVILYNYPANIKAFYMKPDPNESHAMHIGRDNGKVASMVLRQHGAGVLDRPAQRLWRQLGPAAQTGPEAGAFRLGGQREEAAVLAPRRAHAAHRPAVASGPTSRASAPAAAHSNSNARSSIRALRSIPPAASSGWS